MNVCVVVKESLKLGGKLEDCSSLLFNNRRGDNRGDKMWFSLK